MQERTRALISHLCEGLVEREEPIKLALLSAVAGESIFLLGPPGVGKSLIARRLKFAFRDGTSFEYLMSKFSTPDEIFGPVSIKKLKDEDKYERLTDRYLPGANIVFLDEIWKAGPAIQNALLTILNEKIYRNGEEDIKVNIRAIITASNELPQAGENLGPLYDRFLIRYEMGPIRKAQNFLRMITSTQDVYEDTVPEEIKLQEEELNRWSEEIDQVEIPQPVQDTLQMVRKKIEDFNERPGNEGKAVRIYDRRWKKIVRLLRSSAFLNGRGAVDLMDCFLMMHCLWHDPQQKEPVYQIVSEAIRNHGYSVSVRLSMLRREVAQLEEDVDQEVRIRRSVEEDTPKTVDDTYFELVNDEKQFEGQFVKIKDYRQLPADEPMVVNLYDGEKNLARRLKAKKGREAYTVDIFYNSVQYTTSLATQKTRREEIIPREPHRILRQYWDERSEQLLNFISEQEQRLQDERPEEVDQANHHLFIDQELARIVKANLQEVRETLSQLRLRIEKAVYLYQHPFGR